jgi:hypothetical protein
MSSNLSSFRGAFFTHGYSSETCECGREFEDNFVVGEDDGVVLKRFDMVSFEGKNYVIECGCWEKRASQIVGFIDTHKHQIARYLNFEKKRLTDFAKEHPTVDLD